VVKKNGPNFGRLFFACPRTKDDSCEFFQWTHLPRQTDKRGGVSSRKASRRVTEEEADLSRRATTPSKVSQDDLLSVNLSELMEEFTIVASGR
jgi:hypothetical protein